jgi:hypothetical protein
VAHVGEELALGFAGRVGVVARDTELLVAPDSLGLARRQCLGALDDHHLEDLGAPLELAAVAGHQPGDQAEGNEQDHDDQDVDRQDLLLVLDDAAFDLQAHLARQVQDVVEDGIEVLVQFAADDARAVAQRPAIHNEPVEFHDLELQADHCRPRSGQCVDLPDRSHAAINGRVDEFLGRPNAVAHVALDVDVRVTAQRFLEPQVGRGDFLLHVLIELDAARVALEVLLGEVLRVDDERDRNHADHRDTGNQRP